jgi:oligopeptidase B
MQTVKKGAPYPSCLLTGGLHDPRVQYWEISKFTATLRHNILQGSGNDANDASSDARCIVCCKIDMTAGHFSASDRYKYLRELSFDFAFLLDQVGLAA